MLKKTQQADPTPCFPQASPPQGAGWEGTCCDSAWRRQEWCWLAGRRNLRNGQKLWLMHPSKENVIPQPSSLPAPAAQLRTKYLPPGEGGSVLFLWNFSPWLFDLTHSPQLEHLLHCSGLQLFPTCATFHLVKLMITSPCETRAGYALWRNIQGSVVWGLHLGHCLDRVSELIASHEEPALSSSSARHKGSLHHPLCLQEFTFCSHYLCLFLRFSLPWCTIHFIAPWIFPCISCLCSLWVSFLGFFSSSTLSTEASC